MASSYQGNQVNRGRGSDQVIRQTGPGHAYEAPPDIGKHLNVLLNRDLTIKSSLPLEIQSRVKRTLTDAELVLPRTISVGAASTTEYDAERVLIAVASVERYYSSGMFKKPTSPSDRAALLARALEKGPVWPTPPSQYGLVASCDAALPQDAPTRNLPHFNSQSYPFVLPATSASRAEHEHSQPGITQASMSYYPQPVHNTNTTPEINHNHEITELSQDTFSLPTTRGPDGLYFSYLNCHAPAPSSAQPPRGSMAPPNYIPGRHGPHASKDTSEVQRVTPAVSPAPPPQRSIIPANREPEYHGPHANNQLRHRSQSGTQAGPPPPEAFHHRSPNSNELKLIPYDAKGSVGYFLPNLDFPGVCMPDGRTDMPNLASTAVLAPLPASFQKSKDVYDWIQSLTHQNNSGRLTCTLAPKANMALVEFDTADAKMAAFRAPRANPEGGHFVGLFHFAGLVDQEYSVRKASSTVFAIASATKAPLVHGI